MCVRGTNGTCTYFVIRDIQERERRRLFLAIVVLFLARLLDVSLQLFDRSVERSVIVKALLPQGGLEAKVSVRRAQYHMHATHRPVFLRLFLPPLPKIGQILQIALLLL